MRADSRVGPEADRALGRVAVVIPARDEAAGLEALLPSLLGLGPGQVVVADNASRDATPDVARRFGVDLVTEPSLGYGAACAAGVQGLGEQIEFVVFLDADLADDHTRLPDLVEPLASGRADLVIGVRPDRLQDAGAMTPPQRFGNRLATTLIGLLWGHSYTDLGPFRAIRRSALERLDLRDRRFGWTVEMQVRALQEGLRVMEVPVRYRARAHGRSKISGTVRGVVRAGASILYTIGRLTMHDVWRRVPRMRASRQ